ncbi:enoyl-CoA hydratase/isomerase family protein [Chloroflexota bacterium]
MKYDSCETLLVEVIGSVGIVTLNRPDNLNTVNAQMSAELMQVVAAVNEDDNIRVVVFTGAGDKAFSAGGDIRESRGRDFQTHTAVVRGLLDLTIMVEGVKKPVIAAVNGYAIGMGFELALSCDIVFATEKSIFSAPEVNIGMFPQAGGPQRLPRIVGNSKAKELMFTGRKVSAAEALEIGLVNRVVASKEALTEAYMEFGRQLAEKPPLALQQIKFLVNKGSEMPLPLALEYSHEAATLVNTSEDKKEGQQSFLEKRKPQFKGR